MTIREFMHWNRPFNLPILRQNRYGRPLAALQDDMNRLFENFLEDVGESALGTWVGNGNGSSFPAMDVVEDEKDYKVRAELPGISPDRIEVSVTNGYLTIKGEKEEERKEEGENYLRREASYGAFQRTVALPDAADMDKAEAVYRNGILTIEVPKKAEALQKPKRLTVRKAA